jgi:hypothetical protein
MIVYVESNFILELAYLQEEHEACSHILRLAEERAILLAVPAFCLGEPYEAWFRRNKRRDDFIEQFANEMRQLSRSQPFSDLRRPSQEVENALARSGEEEKRRLDETLQRLVDVATILPLDREVVRAGIDAQRSTALSAQDAIVYTSVRLHLSTVPAERKCFVTKNSDDFSIPEIRRELGVHNCRLMFRFQHGLSYIQSQLRRGQKDELP